MFELNKNNVKKILLIITYTIFLCFAIIKFNVVLRVLEYILNLLKPFIFGFFVAFILNIPLGKIEDLVHKISRKLKDKKNSKSKKKEVKNITKVNTKLRAFSLTVSILIFIGIILLTMFLVIPEFINTISIFKENIPAAFNNVKDGVQEVMRNNLNVAEKIKEFTPDWNKVDNNVTQWVKTKATGILGISINVVIGLFKEIVNFFIGLIFAIYMLMQKEKLINQLKKVLKVYVKESVYEKITHVGGITSEMFKNFFCGQFIEAIILGILCFIGMTIFKMPYSLTISVLIGVTALIPVFGAFFGTIIGAILILAASPKMALWFIVYIIVIQQIDGSFIYPRVVGNSVGLPGIWVMLAVLVGANSLGVVGMLVAIPIASVVYKLVKGYVEKKKIQEE